MSEIVSIVPECQISYRFDSEIQPERNKIASCSYESEYIKSLSEQLNSNAIRLEPFDVVSLSRIAERIGMFAGRYLFLVDENERVMDALNSFNASPFLNDLQYLYNSEVNKVVIGIMSDHVSPKIGNEFLHLKGLDKIFKALLMAIRQCSEDTITGEEEKFLRLTLAAQVVKDSNELSNIRHNWQRGNGTVSGELNIHNHPTVIGREGSALAGMQSATLQMSKANPILVMSSLLKKVKNEIEMTIVQTLNCKSETEQKNENPQHYQTVTFELVTKFQNERKVSGISLRQFSNKHNASYLTLNQFVKVNGNLTKYGEIRKSETLSKSYHVVTYAHIEKWQQKIKDDEPFESMIDFSRRHNIKLDHLRRYVTATGKLSSSGETLKKKAQGGVFLKIKPTNIFELQTLLTLCNDKKFISDYAKRNNISRTAIRNYIRKDGSLTTRGREKLRSDLVKNPSLFNCPLANPAKATQQS